MSLLEIIVSMLICGIGMVGTISAIQASQRLATSAEYRSIATREIQSAVDMMRANRLGADAYIAATNPSQDDDTNPYGDAGLALCKDRTPDDGANGDRTVSPPTARSICLNAMDRARKIATEEANRWQNRIANTLPRGKGTITGSDKGGIYIFNVKITWVIGKEVNAIAYGSGGGSSSGSSTTTGGGSTGSSNTGSSSNDCSFDWTQVTQSSSVNTVRIQLPPIGCSVGEYTVVENYMLIDKDGYLFSDEFSSLNSQKLIPMYPPTVYTGNVPYGKNTVYGADSNSDSSNIITDTLEMSFAL